MFWTNIKNSILFIIPCILALRNDFIKQSTYRSLPQHAEFMYVSKMCQLGQPKICDSESYTYVLHMYTWH